MELYINKVYLRGYDMKIFKKFHKICRESGYIFI